MKKQAISILLALALTLSFLPSLSLSARAQADSGRCGDNLTWSFDETSGRLTVEGSGPMDDYWYISDEFAPWKAYREKITSVSLPDGLTGIGDYAFQNCSVLTAVTIPDSVTEIGSYAFCGCRSLASVHLGSGVECIGMSAFQSCGALTGIRLPDSLKQIELYAFSESGLTGVTIPGSVSIIGWDAFSLCENLASATISEGVTALGFHMFANCTALTSVTLPESLTYIDNDAFRGCTALKALTIPAGVECIEFETFLGCTALTDVSIPDSVTCIDESAFQDCASLTGIAIPAGVTEIGSSAFSGCTALAEIAIPDSVTEIGAGAFHNTAYSNQEGNWTGDLLYLDGWLIEAREGVTEAAILPDTRGIIKSLFFECKSLTSVSIPACVTVIERSMFDGCDALTDVVMSDSVTAIEPFAFYGCTGLTSLRLSEGLTDIGERAFEDCILLSNVTFPASLKHIAYNAFCNTGLTNAALPAGLERLGSGAFAKCRQMTSISVSKENSLFSDEDGVLFSKDGKELLVYPAGRPGPYAIPDSVTEIGSYAFLGCTGLAHLTVPKTVEIIGWGAFACCAMESLTILNPKCDIIQVEYNDNFVNEDLTLGSIPWVYGYRGSTAETIARSYCNVFRPIVNGPVPDEPCGGNHCPGSAFADVPSGWAHDPIDWAVTCGITSGTSSTTFSPDQGCTRGQVVTFLWRAAGCPEPESAKNPFSDVKTGAFYYKAVLWAVEQGVTNGTSGNTFSPDATCTRGQIVTFIWRANGSPKSASSPNAFTDVQPDGFYFPAMLWAAEYAITTGVSPTSFAPGAACTRAQVVAFLYRAASNDAPKGQNRYQIVISDAAWDEALADAHSRGGKLLSIDSPEEYHTVLDLITQRGYENVFFNLGGRRADDGEVYYWTDADGDFVGEPLNGDGVWCAGYWEPGEPSFVYKDRQETVLMMYYSSAAHRWLWYDGDASFRNENRTYGYIIEFNG